MIYLLGIVSDANNPTQHIAVGVITGFVVGIAWLVVWITGINDVVEAIGVVMFDTGFRFVKGAHSSIQVKFKFDAWNPVIEAEIIGQELVESFVGVHTVMNPGSVLINVDGIAAHLAVQHTVEHIE